MSGEVPESPEVLAERAKKLRGKGETLLREADLLEAQAELLAVRPVRADAVGQAEAAVKVAEERQREAAELEERQTSRLRDARQILEGIAEPDPEASFLARVEQETKLAMGQKIAAEFADLAQQATAERQRADETLTAARQALTEAQDSLDELDAAIGDDPLSWPTTARDTRDSRTCWLILLQAAIAEDDPEREAPDPGVLRRAKIAAMRWLRWTNLLPQLEAEAGKKAVREFLDTPPSFYRAADGSLGYAPGGRQGVLEQQVVQAQQMQAVLNIHP